MGFHTFWCPGTSISNADAPRINENYTFTGYADIKDSAHSLLIIPGPGFLNGKIFGFDISWSRIKRPSAGSQFLLQWFLIQESTVIVLFSNENKYSICFEKFHPKGRPRNKSADLLRTYFSDLLRTYYVALSNCLLACLIVYMLLPSILMPSCWSHPCTSGSTQCWRRRAGWPSIRGVALWLVFLVWHPVCTA